MLPSGILTQSSTGKLLYDPFDGAVTDNWTVVAGTVAIESGQLSCLASGGGTYAGVKSQATYSGNLVLEGDWTATVGDLHLLWHFASSKYYRFYVPDGTGITAALAKFDGTLQTLDTEVITCTLGVRYHYKIVHIGSSIKIYWDGALILTATDASATSGILYLRAYDAVADTAHGHYDNISICSGNTITCQGLTNGWDLVCGSLSAVASGGSATLDLAGQPIPQATIQLWDASDAIQAILAPSGGVWGGDAYLVAGRWAALKERDGTEVRSLLCDRIAVQVDDGRDAVRTCELALPLEDRADLTLGRRVDVTDGAEPLFVGYIDEATAVPDDETVSVNCRDKAGAFIDAGFASDAVYEDPAARETPQLITAVTASSQGGVGTAIQNQAVVYGKKFEKVVETGQYLDEFGNIIDYVIWATAAGTETGSIAGGDYAVHLEHGNYPLYALEFKLDLLAVQDLAGFVVTTGGAVVTKKGSTDAETWATWAAGNARYLWVRIEGGHEIACGATITTAVEFAVANILTDDADTWRPAETDLRPWVRFQLLATVPIANEAVGTGDGTTTGFNLDWFPVTANSQVLTVAGAAVAEATDYTFVDATAAITFLAGKIPAAGAAVVATSYTLPSLGYNVAYIRWGVSDFDRLSLYTYNIEASADGVTNWVTLVSGATAVSGQLTEHVLTQASHLYLRVTVTAATGPVAIRYARVQRIDATNTLDYLVRTIAAIEGETLFDIPATRRYLPAAMWEAGSSEWSAMRECADLAGRSLRYRRDAYLRSRPRDVWDATDPAIPVWEADMADFSVSVSGGGVYNHVIGVNEQMGVSLRSVAEDWCGTSPTSIQAIGRRTAPTRQFPLATTQETLDIATRQYLAETSRLVRTARGNVAADPTREPGDLVRVREPRTGTDGLFALRGFELVERGETYEMTADVEEVS